MGEGAERPERERSGECWRVVEWRGSRWQEWRGKESNFKAGTAMDGYGRNGKARSGMESHRQARSRAAGEEARVGEWIGRSRPERMGDDRLGEVGCDVARSGR